MSDEVSDTEKQYVEIQIGDLLSLAKFVKNGTGLHEDARARIMKAINESRGVEALLEDLKAN